MNTRHADPDSPRRQERWASASTVGRGLLANLVAKIADQAESPEDRKLIWWIQERSWGEGGLGGLADTLIREHAALVPKSFWTRVATTRAGFEGVPIQTFRPGAPDRERLEQGLEEFALNPDGAARETLRSLVGPVWDAHRAAARSKAVRTSVSARIWDALSRSSSPRGVVMIEGPARVGKTTSARDWCAASGGMARYVATPPGNDLDALLRAIAAALGSAAGLTFKAKQVEERIFRSLGPRGPALIFDDAFRLWPSGDTRQSHPKRLNWLLSLIDHGTPLALITTPQWWNSRREYIAETGWAVDQLDGRIGSIATLPPNLTLEDCAAVARAMIPEGPAIAWEILANLAAASPRRLGAMVSTVEESRFIAHQDGRTVPSLDDVKTAAGYAMATEVRFAQETVRPVQHPSGRAPAVPLPPSGRTAAARPPMGGPVRELAPTAFGQSANPRLGQEVEASEAPV